MKRNAVSVMPSHFESCSETIDNIDYTVLLDKKHVLVSLPIIIGLGLQCFDRGYICRDVEIFFM